MHKHLIIPPFCSSANAYWNVNKPKHEENYMYGSQIKHCHLIKQIIFYFFVSQDALQERYNKEGKFPGPTIIPRRRPWTLLNSLFWATLLLSPLINFACGVVVSGSPLLIIGFILFLIIGGVNSLFRIKVN